MGPYIPYGLFQTTGEMCAKFGSDRLRNMDLYKVQTNIQSFIFIYKINAKLVSVVVDLIHTRESGLGLMFAYAKRKKRVPCV